MTARDDDIGTAQQPAEPGPIVPGDQAASDEVAAAVARLTEDDVPRSERRRALGQIASALRKRGFTDLFRPRSAMTWLADFVVDIAPRIPLRDVAMLRTHCKGLS